jgi:hypothetical protein
LAASDALKAIFGQISIKINRITAVKTGFAKIFLGFLDPAGFQQPLDAEIIQGIQPQMVRQFVNAHAGGN